MPALSPSPGAPDPRVAIDTLLELSVVGSFSRIGPAVRRRLFRWQSPARGALVGRTVLVTGPTSGLGRATTMNLAALGARVVLLGRSEARLAALRAELLARHGEDRFPAVTADMGSLGSVRAAAARIVATEERLDAVVDNAGAILERRTETDDRIEATLATMVVGPFALVASLLPLLDRTPGSRVIAVTSGGMYAQALPLDDLDYRREPYAGVRAYARAKRAQVALMREWARRRAGRPVFVAMHPGWADTPGLAEAMPGFHRAMAPLLRSPDAGAETIAWLATHAAAAELDGGLYLDRRRRPFDRVPWTRLSAVDRRQLWDQVVALAGIEDPAPER